MGSAGWTTTGGYSQSPLSQYGVKMNNLSSGNHQEIDSVIRGGKGLLVRGIFEPGKYEFSIDDILFEFNIERIADGTARLITLTESVGGRSASRTMSISEMASNPLNHLAGKIIEELLAEMVVFIKMEKRE